MLALVLAGSTPKPCAYLERSRRCRFDEPTARFGVPVSGLEPDVPELLVGIAESMGDQRKATKRVRTLATPGT
jgi:hypothetical protein